MSLVGSTKILPLSKKPLLKLRHLLQVCVLLLSQSAVAADEQALNTEKVVRSEIFRQAFESYLEESLLPFTPGLAVAVVVDGKPLLIKAYGVREAGSSAKVDVDTVFRLASVSKTFASAAAGVLVRNGRLQWDTRIAPYVSGVAFKNPDYAGQLTLRHILSHSTGLTPHAYTNLVDANITYRKILGELGNVNFVCAPGNCYGYQNVVYSLVGDIVESVTEETYETFVARYLFTPLQMHNASFGLKALMSNNNHASPHVLRKEKWTPVTVKGNYYRLAPAAGVNASIADMTQWIIAQLGHRQDVLPNVILSEMHARQIRTAKSRKQYGQSDYLQGVYYGLGWRVFDFVDHPNFVHHGGWVQGIRTEVVFNRGLNIGMVMLTNSETRKANEVVRRFLEIYRETVMGATVASVLTAQ
jgi:beta-lactamase class C